MPSLLHSCLTVNNKGRLAIGGLDAVELAENYGTPAYIIDEDYLRRRCRLYKDIMTRRFGRDSLPLFASKALSFKRIYEIIAEEGLGADAVSPGELYTALAAGFPAEKIYFHGNNKTDADIKYGVEAGVGCFVADNREELQALDSAAASAGKKQKFLLRISPGIDPHTHRKVMTGSVDSKFGTPIATGQAMELVKYALGLKSLDFAGIHCHIGSQIFEIDPFADAAENMLGFAADILRETGAACRELNLGGGFGVRYIEDHPYIDYDAMAGAIADKINSVCARLGIGRPKIMLEPGRSMVADSGITLYTVGTVKEITGYKNYVSVDGGMPDNPRYALYSSPYTVVVANRAAENADYPCTIAGRCCESGDLIAENIKIQRCSRGDILAVLVTGAYNYSMASNYNRLPRPPIVMVSGGKTYEAVRRESLADLVWLDI